jgi:hypothetical protein
VTFLCVPLGEGVRQGADLDEDAHLNGEDCNAADAGAWAAVFEVTNLSVGSGSPSPLSWDGQSAATGPGVIYDVTGGNLLALHASGLAAATTCVSGSLTISAFDDGRPDPPVGDGYFYLSRAKNSCATGGFGAGRELLDALSCSP